MSTVATVGKDLEFLKQMSEVVSVGTACGPGINLLKSRFGDGYDSTLVSDGFCLFQKKGGGPGRLKAVFVAHIDEIGGVVYGPEPSGGFTTRVWGNRPAIFADARLQGFDYLAQDGSGCIPVTGRVMGDGPDARLILEGDGIIPYRTVYTFKTEASFGADGDTITGKALDPRMTTYSVIEAVRRLNTDEVGAMIVMAEECAMDVARKGVHFLQKNAPNLELIVNADVPWINNIGEGRLDLPAIRIFEGRNFIDPSFGIRTVDHLLARGVKLHLSAAKSGSQTLLFTPLANTISVALPSDGIHEASYTMSLTGIGRCVDLLQALGEEQLAGRLA